MLAMVSGRSRFGGRVLWFTEISWSELEFVMLSGFSVYTDKVIKVISLRRVTNRGLMIDGIRQ